MTARAPVVLVVEDEPQMLRFLRASLMAHGYLVIETSTAADGIAQAAARSPDVVLLDLGLPDLDGIEVTRRLREWTRTPIIVVSARGRDEDKIRVLDAGADDYLTKPFVVGELLARIRVALRRVADAAAVEETPTFCVDDLRVDISRRQVFLGESEIHLTPTEYKLLTTLVKFADKVVTHRRLLLDVWGPPYVTRTQYLRVFMAQLRQKLEPDPVRPRYLINEPGVGYRLKVR
ncbi:MAG: response regulator [Labilithrix sp.]|nr:response regulator [Labilithrix sp.]